MANFVGGAREIDLDTIGAQIFNGVTTVATETVYRVSVGSNFEELTGNFTYDSAGVLSGGTITGWKQVTIGGNGFTATGLSIPVSQFLTCVADHDFNALANALTAGNDKMTGSAFADALFGAGNDTMAGGAGNDFYSISEIGDLVIERAGQGIDMVVSSINGYVLGQNLENLELSNGVSNGTGNALNNSIIADGSTNNSLDGGLGNDTLDGRNGADTLKGGGGNDTYVLRDNSDDVQENANEGVDTIVATISLTDVSLNSVEFLGIENLVLKVNLNSTGVGNLLDNVISGDKGNSATYLLHGLSGNDTLSGGKLNDTLTGGDGVDVMSGFGGNDVYDVDSAKDKIVELAGKDSGHDTVIAHVSYVLGANLEELHLLDAAFIGTGNGLNNNIYGHAGANKLIGLGGNDALEGRDGSDTLDGGAGNDGLAGGDNNDSLLGGAGNDELIGHAGQDTLRGGAGNDYYEVDGGDVVVEAIGQGIDTISTTELSYTLEGLANVENLTLAGIGASSGTGNNFNNIIESGAGDDTLDGGSGNDTLNGGASDDRLIGGKGNDIYVTDSTLDRIIENANEGVDTVRTGLLNYTLDSINNANVENLNFLAGSYNANGTGNALNNIITGNDGANQLDGGSGNDSLIGGNGNDTLIGGAGADTLAGGVGNDTYDVDNAKDRINELAGKNTGYDTVVSHAESYTLSANIERLDLSTGAVNGAGNAQGNLIYGNDGGNRLAGLAGNDTLDGKTGADTMVGGAGNDLYFVDGTGTDVVVEAAGQGIDQISSAISFTLESKSLANVENLYVDSGVGGGNRLNNVIYSGGGDDTLLGFAGNDTLNGGAGDDIMIGHTGNDTYVIDDFNGLVIETAGEGTDTVIVGSAIGTADMIGLLNVENMVFGGTVGKGNELNNKITGNSLANQIEGRNGNDTLIGGAGDDTYIVDSAKDQIVELAGKDTGYDKVISNSISYTLSANVEDLDLLSGANGTGNALGNKITGNEVNNRLSGLAGNDTLNGINNLLGTDTLAGGIGNDVYIVNNLDTIVVEAAGQGADTIETNLSNFTLDTKALANVENLDLRPAGTANATGTGNRLNNQIIGGLGHDTLNGGAGNDTLDGYVGDDSLIGGKGDDTYVIDTDLDTIQELAGEGRDTIYTSIDLSLALDAAFANIENVKMFEAGGAIDVEGNTLNNNILGNASDNRLDGGNGNDTLIGAAGNDSLYGENGNDSLVGGKGDDIFEGGDGADAMAGGEGNDEYTVDNAKDRIIELAGAGSGTFDLVISSLGNYVLAANVERLHLGAGAGNGTGNALNNEIMGNDGGNKLLGVAGNDSISGGLGADTLDGGAGNDALNGGAGDDSLLGGIGNDILEGESGADSMAGGAGDDRYYVFDNQDQIFESAGQGIDTARVVNDISYTLGANVENGEALGGADITGNDLNNLIDGGLSNSGNNVLSGMGGNDILIAGGGSDTLTGGAGRDRFVIGIAGFGRVTDFDAGALGDALDLSDLLTGYMPGNSDASDFVKFFNTGGNTFVEVDFDGAGTVGGFALVAMLEGVTLTNVNQAVMEGNLLLV